MKKEQEREKKLGYNKSCKSLLNYGGVE